MEDRIEQARCNSETDEAKALTALFNVGDWVKTSINSEFAYEVAEIRQFPHGKMVGIYDEPPSKHIDYWNPSSLVPANAVPRGTNV